MDSKKTVNLDTLPKELRARKLLLAFKAVDYDNRGSINREKLRRFFVSSDISDSMVYEYIKCMDLNSSKEITLGEYKMALGLSSFSLITVKEIFEKLSNKKMTISHTDVLRLKYEGVPEIVVKKIRDFLEDNDHNRDGQADFSEFLGAVASLDI